MDLDKLLNAKFVPREYFFSIPELRPYFDEEVAAAKEAWLKENNKKKIPAATMKSIEAETVGFRLKSLTGEEFGAAKKAAENRKNLVAIADGFLSGAPEKIRDAIKEMYGDADISEEDALNIHLISFSIVWPEIQPDKKMELIKKLYKFYPVDFRHMAMRVFNLTGQGHQPGKP